MRRVPALRRLSSDHHTGLVIARRARRAAREGGRTQAVAWEEVKQRFRAELDGHFRLEERGLLPAMRMTGEAALVERTLREHQAMRTLIVEDRPDDLARFAELLTVHIRFEEKELFETAQNLLTPNVLAALERVSGDGQQASCHPDGPNGTHSIGVDLPPPT